MAFDLDDEELEATRRLNGLDEDLINKSLKNLKEYLDEDLIYSLYKNGQYDKLDGFTEFCVNHCKDIENLLLELRFQKQMNEYYRKIKMPKEEGNDK